MQGGGGGKEYEEEKARLTWYLAYRWTMALAVGTLYAAIITVRPPVQPGLVT